MCVCVLERGYIASERGEREKQRGGHTVVLHPTIKRKRKPNKINKKN